MLFSCYKIGGAVLGKRTLDTVNKKMNKVTDVEIL